MEPTSISSLNKYMFLNILAQTKVHDFSESIHYKAFHFD